MNNRIREREGKNGEREWRAIQENIACGRFSKRGCERERDRDRQRKREREIGREAEGAANRCTACAPFLLDFSKPIERSRSREQHA